MQERLEPISKFMKLISTSIDQLCNDWPIRFFFKLEEKCKTSHPRFSPQFSNDFKNVGKILVGYWLIKIYDEDEPVRFFAIKC